MLFHLTMVGPPGAGRSILVKPDPGGLTLLREAFEAMRLSRARISPHPPRRPHTRADLDGDDAVRRVHLAEALAYRALTDDLRRAA
jgi:magnesium chelatase family protein